VICWWRRPSVRFGGEFGEITLGLGRRLRGEAGGDFWAAMEAAGRDYADGGRFWSFRTAGQQGPKLRLQGSVEGSERKTPTAERLGPVRGVTPKRGVGREGTCEEFAAYVPRPTGGFAEMFRTSFPVLTRWARLFAPTVA